MLVQASPYYLLRASFWARDGLHATSCACVLCSVSQVSLPFAPLLPVGALNLQTPHSALIELVTHELELNTTSRTRSQPRHAPLTKQVTTRSQNRINDQLKTNGTLEVLYLSGVIRYNAVLGPFITVGH